MTAPTPGLIGDSNTQPATTTGPSLINPDGSLNLGGLSAAAVQSGQVSIWDIPQDVIDYQATTAPKPFWYESVAPGGDSSNPAISGSLGRLQRGEITQEEFDKEYGQQTSEQPQYTDAASLMRMLASMSQTDPAKFQSIQVALVNNGFGSINKNEILAGQFGPDTEKAFGVAMDQYLKVAGGSDRAGIPVSFTDFLSKGDSTALAAGSSDDGSDSGSGRAPLTISLTDPAALRQQIQSAASAALGHALTDDQVEKFVNTFHAQEASAQQEAYDDAETGGTVENPDASSQALYSVINNNPGEFANHQAQGYLDTFANMFLAPESQRGGIQPVTGV